MAADCGLGWPRVDALRPWRRSGRFATAPADRRFSLCRLAASTAARVRRRPPAPLTPRLARAGLERRIRRLRPSADDGATRSARRRPISALPRGPVAAGGAPRRVARGVRRADCAGLTPDLRIMDLLDAQPEFTKSFWDYLDLLVSDARIETGRAILAQHRADLRRGREGLWRRPPHHRGDLGRRIQLRHADRRALGDPLDRDARLHRPPPGLFPRGIPLRAGNPRARRRAARPSQGLVGGRLRADPVHADRVQALRGRFRRRRPPRRGRLRSPI